MELTYNVVKDICVQEGVPMMMQDKFLINEKDYVKANADLLEDNKFEDSTGEFFDAQDSRKLNKVRGVKDDSEVVILTLGDIISMEDSQNHLNNNNNINEQEESATRKTELEKTEESILDGNCGTREKQEVNDVLEDTSDHNLLTNGFGERSFSEAGLADITYSGSVSVSGSLSVRSDGSTVSARSFAFPILQSEWNSSPIRMVKPEERQIRKEKGWRHYSLLLCCRF